MNKVCLMIKIARELKFYTRMVTSGSKSVKKGQKMLKKPQFGVISGFSEKNLPWLI